ncbi:ADP-ribose pyrophosphatase [Streptomyces poonensis]|uniref:ADP-ribose pyrophosphatase n=1 Tax=Streptomyces poonensis TaxID=68255 RepID=A0A918PBI8_9ACTN|nr:ADP-ribose pyrophosphatase [Streptomyces poonensis]
MYTSEHLAVFRDEVIRPDGMDGTYDWVAVPDMVRVAALVDGDLLVAEQFHYLTGLMWQLPGGSVDPSDRDPLAAAQRELREETGYKGGLWTSYGAVNPLPGLTPARVHLWRAEHLVLGDAAPDPAEADLRLRRVSLRTAAQAVREGRLPCATSVALIRAIVLGRDGDL